MIWPFFKSEVYLLNLNLKLQYEIEHSVNP